MILHRAKKRSYEHLNLNWKLFIIKNFIVFSNLVVSKDKIFFTTFLKELSLLFILKKFCSEPVTQKCFVENMFRKIQFTREDRVRRQTSSEFFW